MTLRNKYPLNLLWEVPNLRYWCKIRVSSKWLRDAHWEYIQHTSRPKANAAPAPTLSRMGLQYCQFSFFLSESLSLCFICWTFCEVLAILSSRCRFFTLQGREAMSHQQKPDAYAVSRMIFPMILRCKSRKSFSFLWLKKKIFFKRLPAIRCGWECKHDCGSK